MTSPAAVPDPVPWTAALAWSAEIRDAVAAFEALARARHALRAVAADADHLAGRLAQLADTAAAAAREGAAVRADLTTAQDAVARWADAGRRWAAETDAERQDLARMLDLVTALTQQAQSVGGMVRVVAEVADATNLLALNAAIEAARAGDAGRGFAVVAEEVRALAQRTKQATSEASDVLRGVTESTQQAQGALETVRRRAAAYQDGQAQAAQELGALAAQWTALLPRLDAGLDALAAVERTIAEVAPRQAALRDALRAALAAFDEAGRALAGAIERADATRREGLAGTAPPLAAVLRMAAADHLLWRYRLYRAWLDGQPVDPAAAGDAHACRLGRALDGLDAAQRATPAFAAVADQHRAVHATTADLARAIQAGRDPDPAALAAWIDGGQALVRALDAWADALEGSPDALR